MSGRLTKWQFGRAWSLAMQPSDPPPAMVPPRILSKLALYTPPKELVDLYLGEIAKSYGVLYEVAQPMDKLEDDTEVIDKGSDDEGGLGGPGNGQEKEAPVAADDKTPKKVSKGEQVENKDPELGTGTATTLPEVPATTASVPVKKVNEDDELAKRFERLKNLK